MSRRAKRQLLRRSLILGSFMLFPLTIHYFSPVLIVTGAAQGVLSGSAAVFTLQFLTALLLGRAFCGWACPGAGLQEACSIAQPKRVEGKTWDGVKYVIWVPWMGGVAYLLATNGVGSIEIFYMMDSPISISSPGHYPIYLTVTGLIFLLALAVGRRGFCHTTCWMAPFMVLGAMVQRKLRLPALHLDANAERCVECNRCSKECPMSLDVAGMAASGDMGNTECVLCGNCADVCKKGVIRFSFGRTGE